MSTINAESEVRKRYAAGAQATEAKLCCPVDYNTEYLKVIPNEVIERDYGCGDPSKYLQEGEILLDALPRSPEEWARFDVIIMGDLPASMFSREQLDQLKEHIAVRGAGLLWVGIWFRQIHDDPADDPRVGVAERGMLAASSSGTAATSFADLIDVLLRAPVAGIAVAHFAVTWTLYVLLSWLPSYFRDVQHLTIAGAGFYAAAPWLTMFAATNLAAVAADRMIERGTGIVRTRAIFQCGSLVATGLLLLLLQGAHTPLHALSLLCVATATLGCSWAGFAPGMLDIAPRHGAVLYGFSNTFATLPGIFGVYVTGWLVELTGGYTAAFALTAAVNLIGAVTFGALFRVKAEDAV